MQDCRGKAVGKRIWKLNFTDMRNLLLFGSFGAGEVVVIALIVLLLFGGKKIPELMKGIGKGVKSFKDGVKGIEDEINADVTADNKKEEK